MGFLRALVILAISALSINVIAATNESTSTINIIQKNLRFKYTVGLLGGSVSQGDGLAGEGSSLQLEHYFSPGYTLAKDLTLDVTFLVFQKLSSGKEQMSLANTFSPYLPYLTLFRSNIIDSGGWNMGGMVRYYIPVNSTQKKIGTQKDQGWGAVRIHVYPAYSFWNKKMSVSLPLGYYRYFPSQPIASTTIDRFRFEPTLSYKITDTIKTYTTYGLFGYRRQSGEWGKTFGVKGGQADGLNFQYVEVGLNLAPIKGLDINPYLSKRVERAARDTEYALYVGYRLQ